MLELSFRQSAEFLADLDSYEESAPKKANLSMDFWLLISDSSNIFEDLCLNKTISCPTDIKLDTILPDSKLEKRSNSIFLTKKSVRPF